MFSNLRRILFLTLCLFLCLSLCFFTSCSGEFFNLLDYDTIPTMNSTQSADVKVHYIDVGQGNAVLIESAGEYMLIDAGTTESSNKLAEYLKNVGVNTITYLIATHPHEDHIGGMKKILTDFSIQNIIMPRKEATTKTFENFIDLIIEKDIPVQEPKVKNSYKIGLADFSILGPMSSDYKDLNDYSVIVKLVYGEISFLFTGDATTVSETELLESGQDLSADVFLVGHHGSSSSTKAEFLKKVNPSYAVISVGKDNSYGHPTQKVLDRLTPLNIQLYRTDISGSIVASTDGTGINFETER